MFTRFAFQVSSALVLSLLMPSLPALAQAPAKPQPIRIGLILPLTGGSSDMGNSARVGAQVAVDELNEVGGYLGRIFDPFFTTKPVGKGSGLGLFVVHEITAEHGGRVSIDNGQDGGTRVTLWIPAEEEA